MTREERFLRNLFAKAAIEINGTRPWDIQLHDNNFYSRVLAAGALGFGETYMDGLWDCQRLDILIDKILTHDIGVKPRLNFETLLLTLRARLLNRQNIRGARKAADVHYDLDVDIFESTFDDRLTGSCAYWPHADNLNQAQEHKLDLICRKIGLEKGQKVLDIGCGWGAFMGYAAERYGASLVGVTISRQQVDYATKRYAGLPLDFQLKDYRNSTDHVDHVVSMGMFEHVGSKNYRTYFECVRRALDGNNGFFLLHTIFSKFRNKTINPWIDKYIFPNGELPTIGQIGAAVEGLFVIEDVHNFGPDYDRTLMAWNEKFQIHRSALEARYGDRFCRMWEYYLLSCAGGFRSRWLSLGQFVLSPQGVAGGYQSVR